MHGRTWAAVCGALIGLVLAAPASAQYTPGARSLNDVYLPKLGNGGYDALHYDITFDYDPVADNVLASADITLKATQALSEFSLDFRGLNISAVTIDGVAATFTRDEPNDKLIITPASGIDNNRTFHVVVAYNGVPQRVIDPDGSSEGWIRTLDSATRSLGTVVMNEPMGAMAIYPNNNHPRDKATYDFHLTTPAAYIPIGNGELASKTDNPNGTSTWNWHMGHPMASYLSTTTVGRFDYTPYSGATAKGRAGQPLLLYDFIESALPTNTKNTNNAARVRQDAIVKFMADSIGAPYPFESHGVVAKRSQAGYALEVQTKSHFSTNTAGIGLGTLAHEIAHMWFGDSVGPDSWREIWFNEGWATWWSTYWSNKQNNNPLTTAQFFTDNYNGFDAGDWATPPAQLPGAADLFHTEPVYTRPAMMWEAYRQIVGDTAFWAFQKAVVTQYEHKVITTDQVVALAKQIAQEKGGFEASNLAKLDQFFQQWLWTSGKPSLNPTTFFQSTSVPGNVSGTVPATLSLTVTPTASLGNFTPGVARDYSTSLGAGVISTGGDATLAVTDTSATAPGRLVNGAFSLAQPLQSRVAPAAFAPISASPLTLKSYPGPVSNDQVTIDFQQSIGSADALRSGTYSKSLTFTLSTTSP